MLHTTVSLTNSIDANYPRLPLILQFCVGKQPLASRHAGVRVKFYVPLVRVDVGDTVATHCLSVIFKHIAARLLEVHDDVRFDDL